VHVDLFKLIIATSDTVATIGGTTESVIFSHVAYKSREERFSNLLDLLNYTRKDIAGITH
jgi:hypothetical protein